MFLSLSRRSLEHSCPKLSILSPTPDLDLILISCCARNLHINSHCIQIHADQVSYYQVNLAVTSFRCWHTGTEGFISTSKCCFGRAEKKLGNNVSNKVGSSKFDYGGALCIISISTACISSVCMMTHKKALRLFLNPKNKRSSQSDQICVSDFNVGASSNPWHFLKLVPIWFKLFGLLVSVYACDSGANIAWAGATGETAVCGGGEGQCATSESDTGEGPVGDPHCINQCRTAGSQQTVCAIGSDERGRKVVECGKGIKVNKMDAFTVKYLCKVSSSNWTVIMTTLEQVSVY